jgi:hypothetical protein
VRVCACREPGHLFERMLIDEAVVVIPGHRGRWLRSKSERLAHELASRGHTVTFADDAQWDDRQARRARPMGPRTVCSNMAGSFRP